MFLVPRFHGFLFYLTVVTAKVYLQDNGSLHSIDLHPQPSK